MKKIIKHVVIILLFTSIFCISFNNITSASSTSSASSASWSLNSFDNLASKGSIGSAGTTTKNIVGTIIQTIRIVGTGVAIIMITYVAIKYMSAAPSEKAEFKKSATAYIVGAIVLFASTNIIGVISNFANNNIKSS